MPIKTVVYLLLQDQMKYCKLYSTISRVTCSGWLEFEKKKLSASTQSRTEDRYITSVAPYQLGHRSFLTVDEGLTESHICIHKTV